jgi:hypothetical protein
VSEVTSTGCQPVGTGAPEIAVIDGVTNIPDGTGTVSFGSTVMETPVVKTFTVSNGGTTNLTLTEPISVPAGFSVVSSFGSTTVPPSSSTTFTVQLNATAVGTYSGTLSFGNNDSDENPFNFTISGVVDPQKLNLPIILKLGAVTE